MFTSTVKMRRKCDLSDFDRGMIVGARQGGLSISEKLLISWDFHTQQSVDFTQSGAKNN